MQAILNCANAFLQYDRVLMSRVHSRTPKLPRIMASRRVVVSCGAKIYLGYSGPCANSDERSSFGFEQLQRRLLCCVQLGGGLPMVRTCDQLLPNALGAKHEYPNFLPMTNQIIMAVSLFSFSNPLIECHKKLAVYIETFENLTKKVRWSSVSANCTRVLLYITCYSRKEEM